MGEGEGSAGNNGNEDKDKLISDLRSAEKRLRNELREAQDKAETAEKKLAKATEDQEKAVADARAAGVSEGKKESEKEHASALASAEVRARAARYLADPDDAPKFLDLEALTDNGKPNVEKVDKALTELVEKKPYLAASGSKGAGKEGNNGDGSHGNGDGGARKSAPATGDAKMDTLIRGQLKR